MSAPPIRLMIVDDHAVVREGIEAIFRQHGDIRVVASVSSGEEALAAAAAGDIDVVVLDLRMPEMDGLAVLEALRTRHGRLKIVILSGQSGDEGIFRALSGGAAGYLLKSASGVELAEGVRGAMRGRLRPSPEVADRLANHAFYSELSAREAEVLTHVARGATNKQIGTALGLAENTVKNHMKRVIEKLHASDRTEAVTIAVRRGVIRLED